MQILHIASADRPVTLYSLDVIISVGYRVKSHRGTRVTSAASFGGGSVSIPTWTI